MNFETHPKTKDIESIEKHITTDFEGQICYVLSFFVLLYNVSIVKKGGQRILSVTLFCQQSLLIVMLIIAGHNCTLCNRTPKMKEALNLLYFKASNDFYGRGDGI